ncbi:Threonine dehydrogenase [Alkalispirochaeta americana]|uniref:Threonine dehydrogenase n=1 Tax=Alkalispirochaeta americana TaxID=159291 RepID=A0A1N6NEZ5_9SPIO|nr:zinc-binding dehydrogenase [Alkalispirochaeta americana]SIP90688.1 Threonine dehydrogenase [Alkalispirochaeta americana]
MKTKAVRMYGKNDLRLEEFELPPLQPGEILARVVSDSLCMSSYKAAIQGSGHKRVPADIDQKPVLLGHELCGEILQVGAKWEGRFSPGQRFSIQPALNYRGSLDAPGYSYRYIGGNATCVIIPEEVMEMDCLLEYQGDAFFLGSLAEPISCVAGAFHANYHTTQGSYDHSMGIVEGGKTAILAGVGPMGLAAIDYAIHNPRRPGLLVVTDIDQERLDRAARVYTVEDARNHGVDLHYVNTSRGESEQALLDLTGGTGYDDVFVFAPVRSVLEQGDRLLGHDGCLNFFAGPSNSDFRAELNFYEVHYSAHHLVGTSGGNTDDMREALDLMGRGLVNPAGMITHVGGLNAVIETTLNLPSIPGGKKLIYTHKNLPLVAIDEFAERGKNEPFYAGLAEICEKHNNIWSIEAEEYLLREAPEI